MKEKTVDILLVEDDPGDVELFKEALHPREAMVNIQVVENGVKAMAYLRQEGPYAGGVRPSLILLERSPQSASQWIPWSLFSLSSQIAQPCAPEQAE